LPSAPHAVGESVLADMGGKLLPARVLEVDDRANRYFVRYDGWTKYHDAWVSPAGIKLQDDAVFHEAGNLLIVLLFMLTGSVVAVAFHSARERRRDAGPGETEPQPTG
jgi:hypothetical protein